MKYLQLRDIDAYRIAFHLSNRVWDIVRTWDFFAKDTVGKQFVRSVDSISANLAEGFGRYTKKDRILFYRYADASVKESLDWNQKALCRKLMETEQYKQIFQELQKLPKEIRGLINFTNQRLKI